MREIKFRAWDTSIILTKEYMDWCEEKKLFLGGKTKVIDKQIEQYEKETGEKHTKIANKMVYDIHVSNKGKMMDLEGGWDYFGDNDNAVVMQYTGLKDKSGKEIYEGDIVKCVNGHIGEVHWEEHDCCFNVSNYYSQSDDYPSMAFMEGQPMEVIGNIYSNPQLLNN
jgi:uncharacterized phage protein (TIGR01671 family)